MGHGLPAGVAEGLGSSASPAVRGRGNFEAQTRWAADHHKTTSCTPPRISPGETRMREPAPYAIDWGQERWAGPDKGLPGIRSAPLDDARAPRSAQAPSATTRPRAIRAQRPNDEGTPPRKAALALGCPPAGRLLSAGIVDPAGRWSAIRGGTCRAQAGRTRPGAGADIRAGRACRPDGPLLHGMFIPPRRGRGWVADAWELLEKLGVEGDTRSTRVLRGSADGRTAGRRASRRSDGGAVRAQLSGATSTSSPRSGALCTTFAKTSQKFTAARDTAEGGPPRSGEHYVWGTCRSVLGDVLRGKEASLGRSIRTNVGVCM